MFPVTTGVLSLVGHLGPHILVTSTKSSVRIQDGNKIGLKCRYEEYRFQWVEYSFHIHSEPRFHSNLRIHCLRLIKLHKVVSRVLDFIPLVLAWLPAASVTGRGFWH